MMEFLIKRKRGILKDTFQVIFLLGLLKLQIQIQSNVI